MNNRICIIGGPRTGSTWLESILTRNLHRYENYCQGAEFFQISKFFNFEIKENFIVESKQPIDLFDPTQPNTIEFVNHRLSMLEQADHSQPFLFRLFFKPYELPTLDYINLLEKLKNIGFTFILLKRSNILDRALSWYFANNTKIFHRVEKQGKTFLNTEDRGEIEGTAKLKKRKVDLSEFKELYCLLLAEELIRNLVEEKIKPPVIHYTDLTNNRYKDVFNIANSPIKKLYNTPYKDVIKNYQDVLTLVEELNKTYNYEQK